MTIINHVRARDVCVLADKKEVAERALAVCMLLGIEPVNTNAIDHRAGCWVIPGDNAIGMAGQPPKYGRWTYKERAAVSYCVTEMIDIQS